LRAGADDYLVKPFSARELLARVGGLIELSRVRREAERDLRAAVAREEAARVEAEAAVRARDEFLSVAAHELKTPITSLSGTAQLQLRRLDLTGQLDPDQVARAYRLFAQQSAKLVALINQLLDVSRIAVGKLALQTGPEDVGALVREVADLARGRSERHPIVVRAAGPVIASVDRLRLEQVITNLLDNAIKYSPKGGDIHVEIDPPSGGLVAIRVRDHGLGIAPEHRAHIFERFYQVHRDPSLAGMGLGLYVSREIVELHGGRIRAEFPPDGGSCFVVELPLAEADARRGPQDGAPAGSDGERST
jgi:signal transduction histidine kinase